jgi:D-alanyl-D-alanine carboxypeptidase (penicillin-binding protein 5/6)
MTYVTLLKRMSRLQISPAHRPLVGIVFLAVGIAALAGIATGYRILVGQGSKSGFDLSPLGPKTVWQLELDPSATPPAVTAQAYWLYERSSGSLIAESNSQTATSVASLAKLMTAYVSYDTYNLDRVVTVGSASAVLGNRAKFYPQDKYRVYDLLQALLIFSANDAAETLAQSHPQGREGFISAMNTTARALGLDQTSFDNPTGLDSDDQFSSARDLGILADAILELPTVSQVVSRPVVTIYEQQTGRPTVVYSTNALLSRDPRYQGVKTGTTDLAGESLIVRFVDPIATSSATPEGADYLLVLLGSQQRFIDAPALIEWARTAAQPVQRTLQ